MLSRLLPNMFRISLAILALGLIPRGTSITNSVTGEKSYEIRTYYIRYPVHTFRHLSHDRPNQRIICNRLVVGIEGARLKLDHGRRRLIIVGRTIRTVRVLLVRDRRLNYGRAPIPADSYAYGITACSRPYSSKIIEHRSVYSIGVVPTEGRSAY
jgi:hypothetical protein